MTNQASSHGKLIPADPSQVALTERLVLPHMDTIFRSITELREALDVIVCQHSDANVKLTQTTTEGIQFFAADPLLYEQYAAHVATARPTWAQDYPIGLCGLIRSVVLAYLKKAPVDTLERFFPGLHEFVHSGGTLKAVWGELKGLYFQNAIQLGHLYLDVSNDTVDVTKPKTEWAPLSESGFSNIQSFYVFADLLDRYHHKSIAVNNCLPHLAPLYPLWSWQEDGQLILETNAAMTELAVTTNYRTSRAMITEPPPAAIPLPDWAIAKINQITSTINGADEFVQMSQMNTDGQVHIDDVFDQLIASPRPKRDRHNNLAKAMARLINHTLSGSHQTDEYA